MTTEKTLNKADLKMFTGSEQWYRHGLVRRILFTEGAKYVADVGGAYWLLDEIALTQVSVCAVAAEEFQRWVLTVRADHTATLACDDGNYNPVYTKELTFTDFPLDEITFYFTNDTIYLPSEH